jgi:DNA adenine methylase
MIKSPLRYPGGKSRSVEKIASLVPKFDEFREPFLGGGSVFLYLKQLYPNKKYWVNDLYPELYFFWLASQNNIEGLIHQIEYWKNKYPNGKELHRFLSENISLFNELEKGAAFFLFNRITFSGTTEAGGYSEQAFQGRFTTSSIERLKPFNKIIQNSQITNLDFQEVIEAEGKNVFLFLDPPYYTATKSALYGKNGKLHKIFDHERLANVLKKTKHKWLITYDDSPYIRELFHFANVTSWNLTYGMRNVSEKSSQKAEELFISNYPLFETEKVELRLFAEEEIKY